MKTSVYGFVPFLPSSERYRLPAHSWNLECSKCSADAGPTGKVFCHL